MARSPVSTSQVAEHLSYLLVAVVAVCPAILAGHVVGDGVDLYGTFWFYWWVGHSLEAGLDPGFTEMFFHPLGKDILAHTGSNFVDAYLVQPFRWLLGHPGYQPWFVGVVIWGNALAFRVLARSVLGSVAGVWVATLAWQMNPEILFELLAGRVTQAFAWALPLALWAFLLVPRSPRHGAWAGLFVAVAGWTYWFWGWFLALLFAWMAIGQWRSAPSRADLRKGWLLGAGTCVLAILPGLLPMLAKLKRGAVPGLASGGGLFDAPVAMANNVGAQLHGLVLMETQGQPLLTTWTWLAIAGLVLALSPSRLRWLGGAALMAFFAVGATWPTGEGGVVMAPYMAVYRWVPFMDRLWFHYRLVILAFLCLCVGLGTVIDRIGRTRPTLAVALGICLLGANALEQHRHLAFPLLHRDLEAPAVYGWIGDEGGALIELPIGLARPSIAHQAVHGQPTFGGMGENAPLLWPEGFKERLKIPFIRWLQGITRDPGSARAWADGDLAPLRAEGFRWVLLDRQLVDADIHRWRWGREAEATALGQAPFLVTEAITARLGPPVAMSGPLVVWALGEHGAVPPALRPTTQKLGTRTWSMDFMPAHEAHLRALGRLPELETR